MSNDTGDKKLLPEGSYKVKCVDAALGLAGTGTEQIGLQLEVVDGPHKGSMITGYFFFTEDTQEGTIRSMRALGWKGVDFTKLETIYQGEGTAVIHHEEDKEGNMRARVRWINGIGVVMNQRMEGAELARFSNRMRGIAARIGGSAPAAAGGGNKPAGGQQRAQGGNHEPPPSDDDAPPYERAGRR